jgi:hypothetical protein
MSFVIHLIKITYASLMGLHIQRSSTWAYLVELLLSCFYLFKLNLLSVRHIIYIYLFIFIKSYSILKLRLLQRKIVVKGKYFPFNRKFFFNFRKMVYSFENCKAFSDFENLILKLKYPVKARLGPCQDMTGTCPGPNPGL